jgi:2-dehydropantoate 2-reductase
MRFVVFGTGGAGGYFGAQLALAGQDVIFIARGDHLKAIQHGGLRIETPTGEAVVRPAQATDDPAQVTDVDVILLGVKAWQVTEAAHAILRMIGPETCVIPLQNGVEAHERLAGILGPQHVLGGLCGTLSWIAGPGHIRSAGGRNFIKFGEVNNARSDRVEKLYQTFAQSGVTVEVPSDIVKALWDKFLLITSFGGVGAVTRAPIGIIRAIPETRRLLELCMEEVVALARARQVAIAKTAVADSMKSIDTMPANGTTSLHRDIVNGKPSELEYWNGAVVRLGRENAVPTPVHELIYDCLLPQELHARGKNDFPR